MRHSFATHLIEARVGLQVVQNILGNHSLLTTAKYTRLTQRLIKMGDALALVAVP